MTLFRSHVRDQPMRCLSSLAVLLTLSAPTGAQVPARAKPNEEAKFRAALTKVLGGREKSAYAIAFVTETRDVAREGASLIGLGIDVMIAPLQGAIWLNAGPNPPITTPFPLSRFTAKMIGSPNAPEYQVEIKVFADRKSAVEAITKHVQGPREGWKDVKTWSLVKRTDRVVIASQAADKEQARLGALAKKGAKLKVQRAPGPGK